ncbi:MAG: cadherin repeat domain-containing protein, partial [Betaproteobacteria bacterium]|nr:cadherin repeat domain-containing protein [Betaproteobacteria bacterium]
RGSEQTAAGVAVATVTINNPSVGDISYSLVGSESEIGPFEIGAANGIIRVARATNFDLESKRYYVFAVQATVANSATGLGEQLVTLELTAVNDPPQFGVFATSQRFERGHRRSFVLPVSDVENNPLTITFDPSILPDGISWDPRAGSFSVAGNAPAGD